MTACVVAALPTLSGALFEVFAVASTELTMFALAALTYGLFAVLSTAEMPSELTRRMRQGLTAQVLCSQASHEMVAASLKCRSTVQESVQGKSPRDNAAPVF